MANITINVEHKLTQSEAILRIKEEINKAKDKYGGQVTGFKQEWKGNTLRLSGDVRGKEVSVVAIFRLSTINVEGDIPRMFLFFRGRIEKMIQKEASRLLKP